MKILVTGATGYLGTTVVERLLREGTTTVRCLVRGGSDMSRLLTLRQQHSHGALEIVEGTLTRPDDCARAVDGVARVVHLAASLRGAAADMYLNTAVASQRLYHAIAESRVERLVAMSSLGVYGLAEVASGHVVCEDTPVDALPHRRDVYTQTKILQEKVLARSALPGRIATCVLRAGPLYGRGAPGLSSRIGLQFRSVLLQLGGNARLPLSYVDNCADAVSLFACDDTMPAGTYNVVDDDCPTASEYVTAYRRCVRPIRSIRVPFFMTLALARVNERFHERSHGQFPLVLSRYRARNLWRGHVYSNARLKAAGWRQSVSTADAIRLAMSEMRDPRDARDMRAMQVSTPGSATPGGYSPAALSRLRR